MYEFQAEKQVLTLPVNYVCSEAGRDEGKKDWVSAIRYYHILL